MTRYQHQQWKFFFKNLNAEKDYFFQNNALKPIVTRNKDIFCTKE